MEKVNVMYSAAEVHADISLYAAEFKKEWESFSEEDEKAILARRRLLTMGFSSSSSIHSLDAHIYGVLDKRIFDWYQERFPNSTFLKVDDLRPCSKNTTWYVIVTLVIVARCRKIQWMS